MSLTRLTNQGEHILVGVRATPSFLPILNILCMDRFISQLAGHKRQTSQDVEIVPVLHLHWRGNVVGSWLSSKRPHFPVPAIRKEVQDVERD